MGLEPLVQKAAASFSKALSLKGTIEFDVSFEEGAGARWPIDPLHGRYTTVTRPLRDRHTTVTRPSRDRDNDRNHDRYHDRYVTVT